MSPGSQNKTRPPGQTGGGGGPGDELFAGTVVRDKDGYVTFVGKWVTMEYLKELFNGGPVLRKMPDGSIAEIVGVGTGEDVEPD